MSFNPQGGGGADRSYFEPDGTLVFGGAAVVWDDMRIAGSAVRAGGTAPSLAVFGSSGSLRTYQFSGSALNEVEFEVQLSHAYMPGTDIHPHVHWCPTTTGAGNVVWFLEYAWANIGATFPGSSTINTGAVAAGGTAWAHKMTDLLDGGNDYINGSGKTISSMLVCRLYRNGGSGSDTYAAPVALLEFDFHYILNTVGSREETTK